jgi:hypothetical protein
MRLLALPACRPPIHAGARPVYEVALVRIARWILKATLGRNLLLGPAAGRKLA